MGDNCLSDRPQPSLLNWLCFLILYHEVGRYWLVLGPWRVSPGLRHGQNRTSAPVRRLHLVNKLAGTLGMRVLQEVLAFLASVAATATFNNLLTVWANDRR